MVKITPQMSCESSLSWCSNRHQRHRNSTHKKKRNEEDILACYERLLYLPGTDLQLSIFADVFVINK